MSATKVTPARLRRWVLAAVCGTIGTTAFAQSARVIPASMMNPPPPMAQPVAPAALPVVPGGVAVETVGGCAAGGCDTDAVWTHKDKKAQRKAERKEILYATRSCANTPARQVPPIGTFTRQAFDTQRDNALVEYFVMYDIEWCYATAELNGYGCRHLDGIGRRLGSTSAPVKIEASGIPSLDEARRACVMAKLVACGMDAGSVALRVIVGCGRAEGLRYDEIEAVYDRGRFGGSFGSGGFGGGFGFGGGGGGGFGR